LDEGIDSLVAAADVLRPNGREVEACDLYREAIAKYRELLLMIGPGDMQSDVTSKIGDIEREVVAHCGGA
jgi:hypothetical protein